MKKNRTRAAASDRAEEKSYLVVGIGASAGGLDAFKRFFDAMSADSGMAFVLIQHLDPTHESLTAELLGRRTKMSVVEVQHEMAVEPNHVYVIPPNKYLGISDRILRLTPPGARRGMRMPIDFFLRSLAEDQHERAVGIILSGTGTDGSLGLKEIKAAGGLTVVQDPATAQYDGMPRSAIAIDGIDCVVPIDKMPAMLLTYAQHSYLKEAVAEPPVETKTPGLLTDILNLLRTRANFDFGPYKQRTVLRRIHRRMGLKHVDRGGDYLRLLHDDPQEVQALFKDLLIGVSSFFREPQAWAVLEKEVLPQLVAGKQPRSPLRAWVPGCASGEEAYSLAMLLIEQLQAAQKGCQIEIFASDVDTQALQIARAGVYPESIAIDVSPERLRRFFISGDGTLQVNKEVRESVIFAQQNLIADPPFSKLDLISCRNLLIYLEPEIQKKIISLFHFALVDGGYLLLGSSETTSQADDLFEPVSRKWRVYRRIGPTRYDRVHFPPAEGPERGAEASPRVALASRGNRLGSAVQQLLLDRYAPASVVINRRCEIQHFSGPTHRYLMHPPGPPTQDLIALVRQSLQTRVRGAVHKAIQGSQPVVLSGVRVQRDDGSHRVKVRVEPLNGREMEGLLLVCFEDEPEVAPTAAEATTVAAEPAVAGGDEWVVRQLEAELKTTRDDLQSTIEEMESSNEELKAANEEVMSVNEELQSTNEELETSKEELQSLNEELSTLNVQLQGKVDELERTNNDLDNLLTSTNIATIFLDRQLCVRRFTPAATGLFNLIGSDIGRPIRDIAQRFTDPDFFRDTAAVLEKLVPLQKEVRGETGRLYVRQALPYRTEDNRIDGVVITFSDVAADALQAARLFAEAIVDTVREPLMVLEPDLRVRSANRAFYRTFHTTPDGTQGRPLYELGNGQWDIPQLRSLLSDILPREKELSDFAVDHEFESIGRRSMLLNARTLADGNGPPELILLAIEDVTARKRQEEALRENDAMLSAILDTAADGIITIDARGIIQSFNRAAEAAFGYTAQEAIGQNVAMLMPPPLRDEHDGYIKRYLTTGAPRILGTSREVTGRCKDGTLFPIDLSVSEFHDGKGPRFTGIVRDVSMRKSLEQRQAQLAHVLRVMTAGELATGLAHELNQPLSAIANDVGACAGYVRTGRGEGKKLLKLLDHASAEAVRAGNILHRLREFLQKRELHVEAVDLRELVRNVVVLVDREVKDHDVDLRLGLPSKPLSVLVDRIQIEQVVLNLLRNGIDAIEAARRKQRELRVHVRRAGQMAEVAVRDTGTGLSVEARKRIFDPFFTTRPHGLGMGLVISRSIAEAHRGRLSLDRAADGPGTVARLTLPRQGAAPTRRPRQRRPPSSTKRSLKGVHGA